MKQGVLAAAAWLALTAQTVAPIEPPPCRLKAKVAVGCQGRMDDAAANAADLFARYKLDAAAISKPETKAYLNRFDCLYIEEGSGPLGFRVAGAISLAEPDGDVTVLFVTAAADARKRFMWIAAPYFAGPCPRMKSASVTAQ